MSEGDYLLFLDSAQGSHPFYSTTIPNALGSSTALP